MGSPRKRRLGKILDNLYGDGKRGGHEKNAQVKEMMFDGPVRKASSQYDKKLTTVMEDVEAIFGEKDDLYNIPEEAGKQKSKFMQKASESTTLSGSAFTKWHYYFYNNSAVSSGSHFKTVGAGGNPGAQVPSGTYNFAMTATRSFASLGHSSKAEAISSRTHGTPVDPLSWVRPEKEGIGYSKALPASSWSSSSMWDILTQGRRGDGDWDLKSNGVSPSGYTKAQANAVWPSGTLRSSAAVGGAVTSTKGGPAGVELAIEGLRANHATAGEWTGQGGWSISFWHYYADPKNLIKSSSMKGHTAERGTDVFLPPMAALTERGIRPIEGAGGPQEFTNPIMSFGSWMTGSGTGAGGPRQRRDGVFISVGNVSALTSSEDGTGTKGEINIPMYVFEMEDRWGCEGNGFSAEFPGIQTRRSTAGGRKHNLGVLPDGSPGNRAKRLAGRKMRAYAIDPKLLTASSDGVRSAYKAAGRHYDEDRHFYGWNHVMMVWHGEVSGGTNAQGVGGWTTAVGNNRFPSKPNCEIYINGIQAGFATGTQVAAPLHGGLDEWTKQAGGIHSELSYVVYGTGSTTATAWYGQGGAGNARQRNQGQIASRVFTGSLNPHTAYGTPMFLNGFTNLCTGALHQTGSGHGAGSAGAGGMKHLLGNNGLCDVAIYNVPLTASHAKVIYNGGTPMNLKKNMLDKLPNLCAYWRMGNAVEDLNAEFPGDNGFVIKDQSGFGHDMYLYGHTGSTPSGPQDAARPNRDAESNYSRGYYEQRPLAGVENRTGAGKVKTDVMGAAHHSSSVASGLSKFSPSKNEADTIS